MNFRKKQSDTEVIKQLLAEGLKRDAAEMRFRKVLFWLIFIVTELIALSRVFVWCWPFDNFAFWTIFIDAGITTLVSTFFFIRLRSAFNITTNSKNDESANLLDWIVGPIRWPRWPRL